MKFHRQAFHMKWHPCAKIGRRQIGERPGATPYSTISTEVAHPRYHTPVNYRSACSFLIILITSTTSWLSHLDPISSLFYLRISDFEVILINIPA